MCIRDSIKALEIASDEKWPYLIVLEDDVILAEDFEKRVKSVSYTHLRAHETVLDIVCRLLLEKKKSSDIPDRQMAV